MDLRTIVPLDTETCVASVRKTGRLLVVDEAYSMCGVGAEVVEGQPLLIMNSMKMEHVVHAPASGRLLAVLVEPNATVKSGQPLATIQRGEVSVEEAQEKAVALDFIRPDLAEVETRRAYVEHATP